MKLFSLIFCLAFCVPSNGQDHEIELSDNDLKTTYKAKPPVFRGCDATMSNDDLEDCLLKNVTQHITENFNESILSKMGLEPGLILKTKVLFNFNEAGELSDPEVLSTHDNIKKEIIRLLSSVPNAIPAKNDNGNITSHHVLVVPLKIPEEAFNLKFPIHKRCNENLSYKLQQECTTKKIMNYIQMSVDLELADKLFPQEQSTKIQADFIINKKGKAEQINVKAFKREMAIEAIKVIKRLPKLKHPGYKNGKANLSHHHSK